LLECLCQGLCGGMATHFRSQPQGLRQLDELPWQWEEAAEWPSLADLLVPPGLFEALWVKSELSRTFGFVSQKCGGT
jgi:hypothetical protein